MIKLWKKLTLSEQPKQSCCYFICYSFFFRIRSRGWCGVLAWKCIGALFLQLIFIGVWLLWLPGGSVERSACQCKGCGLLGLGDLLEKELATSSVCSLKSVQRNLACYSPQGHKVRPQLVALECSDNFYSIAKWISCIYICPFFFIFSSHLSPHGAWVEFPELHSRLSSRLSNLNSINSICMSITSLHSFHSLLYLLVSLYARSRKRWYKWSACKTEKRIWSS